MKTSELCIGDWVQAHLVTIEGEERLSPPMYIVAISEEWVQTRVDPEQGDPDEYDIEDIRPIRITEAFMQFNFSGWEKGEPGWWYCFSTGDSTCQDEGIYILFKNDAAISCYWNDVTFESQRHVDIRTRFVHELQHLLRFAGIEDEIKIPRSL